MIPSGYSRFSVAYIGNGDNPSSFRNSLCFAVDSRISFSISTNCLCVADRSICGSDSAVLTYREMFRL